MAKCNKGPQTEPEELYHDSERIKDLMEKQRQAEIVEEPIPYLFSCLMFFGTLLFAMIIILSCTGCSLSLTQQSTHGDNDSHLIDETQSETPSLTLNTKVPGV